MKAVIASAIAAIALGGVAQAQNLQPVEIMDRNGFKQPVLAYRAAAPAGWQVRSGLEWFPRSGCPSQTQRMTYQATAPAGDAKITTIPADMWTWGSMYEEAPYLVSAASQGGGCPAVNLRDAGSYLQMVISQQRQGARIVNMRPRPDVAQDMMQRTAKYYQGGPRPQIDAAEALISYRSGSHTVNELMVTAISIMTQPMPDMNGGMNGYGMTGASFGVITYATTSGQPNGRLLETIRQSFKPDPQYEQRMQQHYAKMNAIAAKGARQRARTNSNAQAKLNQTYNDISDINMKGWQNRNAIQDGMQSRTTDMILEQTPYTNQWGEQVYAPQGYDRVYETNTGEYIGTNDPNYDPYVDDGIDAQEMTPYEY